MRTCRQAILLLMAVVIVFLMAACGPKGETVDAVVVGENGTLAYLVSPLPGEPENGSGDLFDLPKSDVPEGMDLQKGDTVCIRYTGGILELGPAQFKEILSVEKIS